MRSYYDGIPEAAGLAAFTRAVALFNQDLAQQPMIGGSPSQQRISAEIGKKERNSDGFWKGFTGPYMYGDLQIVLSRKNLSIPSLGREIVNITDDENRIFGAVRQLLPKSVGEFGERGLNLAGNTVYFHRKGTFWVVDEPSKIIGEERFYGGAVRQRYKKRVERPHFDLFSQELQKQNPSVRSSSMRNFSLDFLFGIENAQERMKRLFEQVRKITQWRCSSVVGFPYRDAKDLSEHYFIPTLRINGRAGELKFEIEDANSLSRYISTN